MKQAPEEDFDTVELSLVACPVEPAESGDCGGSQPDQAEATGFQPGRQFFPDQLRLSRRSVDEGKIMTVMMEREGMLGAVHRIPAICLTTEENPRKLQLENR